MQLEKYSFGVGDRFAHQGKAQLNAILKAKQAGLNIVPVWNKSYREHSIIHTKPESVRKEADSAVKSLGWSDNYYVDADHINMDNVDEFLKSSNFFTLDVADFIGKNAETDDIQNFVKKYKKYAASLDIEGIDQPIEVTAEQIEKVATKVLLAVQQAGKLYHYIESRKGEDNFITEVSMDETELAQSPVEMLFVLAAISDEGIPAQTIAPKFTGRFNKGVDYAGDVEQFEKEFNRDLAVIGYAVTEFGLPDNLKLSIHSGSDKFSIYKPINQALKRFDAGLHIKTAGTTWLEEIAGLAAAGGKGLAIAKKIYERAYQRFDELCTPYATVIDIDRSKLPSVEQVNSWSSQKFKDTVTHDQTCPDYNPDVRQLLHVGYKVAAEMDNEYTDALEKYEDIIAKHVTANIYERHIKPVFGER